MKPVQNFYYEKRLPEDAVGLMHVRSTPVVPSDYTDKLNVLASSGPTGPGALDARAWPVEAHYFPAVGMGEILTVNNDPEETGQSYEYTLKNQFFEVTNKWDSNGTYFYYHVIPSGITGITLIDEAGNIIEAPYLIEGARLYHSLGGIHWIRYYEDDRLHEDLLTSMLVMPRAPRRNSETPPFVPASTYSLTHGVIDLPANTEHRIRFMEDNRYRILDPYTVLPNDPWYPRIRFNLQPVPAEWTRMLFSPYRPYMAGMWVPGRIVADGVIEFERKRIWWNGSKYPDVLVFDKDYNLKWALDGNPVEMPEKLGYLYPWSRSRFTQIDPLNGRVRVNADIRPDDIIFGFYFYEEQDLIYTALDINPFTNPAVRNKTVELVHCVSASYPERHIWHRIYDHKGALVSDLSFVPAGTATVIGKLVVGGSVSLNEFTVTDVRQRGGGLAPEHHNLPETRDFWDLGYWDGKPYPVKGGLVLYIPEDVRTRFGEDFVKSTIDSVIPVGSVPVIRYYSPNGEER